MIWWIQARCSSIQDEARPKSVVIPETIDAVRQLMLQDLHLIYSEIETTLGIAFNITWTFDCQKKFVRIGLHAICQSLKKESCWLVERNDPKIRLQCFETCLWQREWWWIIEFTRMSPKVNSSLLYGCFRMSQIQQKLLALEAFPSKWSPVFSEKLNMSQSYH